jgi:hypothetical protein
MNHTRLFHAVLVLSVMPTAATALADDQSATLEIVADQVRSQGFACSNPVSADKVEAESKPDLMVYVLTCESVKYHVRLVPNEAAQIRVIE